MPIYKKITFFSSISLVVLLAIILCVVRLPRVFGLTPHIIDDQAMASSYAEGSLIYVQKRKTDTILVGDVITYYENSGKHIVTRRVVAIEDQHQYFYTKADGKTQIEVEAVRDRNIIGTPVFKIPYIGLLFSRHAFNWMKGVFLGIAVCLSSITAWHTYLELKQCREKETDFFSDMQ